MTRSTANRGSARRAQRGLRGLLGLLGLVAAAAILLVVPTGSAFAAGGEGMQKYDAVFAVEPDGSMAVTEQITWRFPAGEQKHGIFRNIVVRMGYNNEPGKYRYFDMTDVDVSSPSGAPAQFQVTDNGATNQIRIGSPDEYTSGTQVYVVEYTLHNVLNPITADGQPATGVAGSAQADTIELNYNVFGPDEQTQRDLVRVTVNAPAAATKVLCFQGPSGSTTRCTGASGDPALFSAMNLAPGDAMTVVASYPASAFGNVRPDVREGNADSAIGSSVAPAVNAAAWVGGIGAPVVALAVMGALVWSRGRDERYADLTPGLSPAYGSGATGDGAPPAATVRGGHQTVAVQFQPPKGVQPGMVGVIIDETANPIDVSATVIDLAVRGFLRIEENDSEGMFSRTDWTLTRLTPPQDELLLPYERKLMDGIFGPRGDVVRLSELKNTFASTLKSIQSEMYREVVTRHWFRSSPQLQRGVWQGLGVVIAVLGGILLFWGRPALDAILGAGFTGGIALGVGLLVAGGIVWFLGGKMAAKTAEGSAVLAQSLGFKEYLTTAEAGQIEFEEASNIFSRYLPYAVVFGVADRWARTFAQVAAAAEAAGQPLIMPTWYVWSGAAFPDFTSIATGVDSFSTTSTGTFTSTPGSSGSSGFSAGGGFSGGGGGGSSSGSW
jgi:hypothetical protein